MPEDQEDPQVSAANELRRRAAERLEGRFADDKELSRLTLQEIRHLVHELQTHQVELELQNDELRRAQEELAASRDRYADLYDFAPVGYVTVGEKGLVQEANLTSAELFGVDRGALLGQPLSNFIAPEDQDVFYRHRREALAGSGPHSCELRLQRGDGRVLHARLDSVAAGEGTCRIALSDITERRQLERELVQLERLRAVGELAAGVSHNLNNMLCTMLGPAQLILRFSDDPEVRREALEILDSARRAQELVHRLNLSVRGVAGDQLEAVPINQVVQEAVQTARPRWKDEPESRGISIEVITELEEVPSIRGTASRLRDILTNLLFNAVDAMLQGGTITIATRAVGTEVQLVFTDTGIGMDEETRRRVFEPFFTTKMDVGSGLGLSTAYGTVSHWGGRIQMESAPGQGTTFALWLPTWTAGESPEEDPAAGVRPARRGKVLVVDDNEKLCRLLSQLLGPQHEVETVRDGREALELFAAGPYDVVLVDLGLPGLPGDRVVREMRRIDPAVGVVLITGWELSRADPRRIAFDFRLQKPFEDLVAVETVVAQALALRDTRAGRG